MAVDRNSDPDQKPKQRTVQQNRALHLWCEQLAQTLNDSGHDMRRTLKPAIDIPWSGETVKEYMFKPIMRAQLNKQSTTQLTTKEIDEVLNTISKHLGETIGVYQEFPSVEQLIREKQAKERNGHRG